MENGIWYLLVDFEILGVYMFLRFCMYVDVFYAYYGRGDGFVYEKCFYATGLIFLYMYMWK